MKQSASYIGFPELPEMDELVDALIYDPPDVRWRVVRALLRLEDEKQLAEVRQKLSQRLSQVLDWEIVYRLKMATEKLQRPVRVNNYVVVKGKGAYTTEEMEAAGNDLNKLDQVVPKPDFYPVIDFHVHPKMPDLKFLSDLRKAEVSHAVILATDTDPADVERPEIKEMLKGIYQKSSVSRSVPFSRVLGEIKSALYSSTHVTDQDVADWVEDYPDVIIGFGSVNLGKSREYVEEKLAEIERLKFKGIKLLPFAQFFNPAEHENMDLFMEFCRRTGTIVLCHTGCAAGPHELPEFSDDSRPELWEPVVKKYPDVPVALAHFGAYSSTRPGIWLREAMELGKKYDNVYADLAAVNYVLEDERAVKEIRKTIGFDKVLFATDYPGPIYFGVSLARVVYDTKHNPYLTEEEKRAVLGENAGKLLGIV
jgi:predicted TIM-barrel fold metal-dependent hydrolase